MEQLPKSIQNTIESFNHLPGIGHKTSERFVFYLLKQPKSVLESFARNLLHLKDTILLCGECFHYSESNPCTICKNRDRDTHTICVVSESADVLALEKAGVFHGRYHVLGGVINQLEGITPETIRIKELVERLHKNGIREVILALNPDIEGETTSLYIAGILKNFDIKITRLARGLPTGSNIEYADELTLLNALEGRREIL